MSEPAPSAVPRIAAYYAPHSVEEAVEQLASGDVKVVAGGTDLMVTANGALRRIKRGLMNIRRIDALGEIEEADGRIRIGALVTLTELIESELLRAKAPILPATADRFASVQIRNAATIGGNIANGSPAADLAPTLFCLDAEVELASWNNGKVAIRSLALADTFAGPGKTHVGVQELITAVTFATPPEGFYAGFQKSGPRPALEIALVAMCLAGRIDKGALHDPRLAFGSVGPTPIRCYETEKLLDGKVLDDDAIEAAIESAEAEIRPIDDHRSTEWYRRQLVRAYLEEELRNVAQG